MSGCWLLFLLILDAGVAPGCTLHICCGLCVPVCVWGWVPKRTVPLGAENPPGRFLLSLLGASASSSSRSLLWGSAPAPLGNAGCITAAFMLASGHRRLGASLLHSYALHSTEQQVYTSAAPGRGRTRVTCTPDTRGPAHVLGHVDPLHVFESLQREGSLVGNLLCTICY